MVRRRRVRFARFAALFAVVPAAALLAVACGGDNLEDLGQPDAALGSDATVGDAGAGSDAQHSTSDAAGDAKSANDAAVNGGDDGAVDAGDGAPDGDAALTDAAGGRRRG